MEAVKSRVLDPYSFDPDPDPDSAFKAGDQSGSRSRDLMTKKLRKKITAEKKFNFFWIKNCNLPIPSLHTVCPNYRRSLQLSKEAIQHFKT
jgi:hypothetical protein